MIYLIPNVLSAGGFAHIPPAVLPAIKICKVIFAENERTVRRFFKSLDRDIVIDDFEWHTIGTSDAQSVTAFRKAVTENKNIAIVSEAGCAGIADPGAELVKIAHAMNAKVTSITGPSSVMLALSASGMNGQHFEFCGYLPIENAAKNKRIAELENDSAKNGSTKIFIETPYRNNQLLESLLSTLKGTTRICIAADLTAQTEYVKTMTAADWKKQKPELHKRPAIFLLNAG